MGKQNSKDFVTCVYWTRDKRWAWQYVGGVYLLYKGEDDGGNFHKEFNSLEELDNYIYKKQRELIV